MLPEIIISILQVKTNCNNSDPTVEFCIAAVVVGCLLCSWYKWKATSMMILKSQSLGDFVVVVLLELPQDLSYCKYTTNRFMTLTRNSILSVH